MGAIYAVETGRVEVYHDSDSFMSALLLRWGIFYAHNGGNFDALFVLEELFNKRGIEPQIINQGQRILSMKYGNSEIRDSYAIIPLSLAKGAALGGTEKLETGLECICGLDCKGYCSIRRDMTPENRKKLERYLIQDCIALAKSLLFLIDYSAANDLDLTNTIGSSSWSYARRLLNLPNADWRAKDYNLARESYYGGRTEVFKLASDSGYRYDINSSYPAALVHTHIPIGECIRVDGASAARHFASGKEGVFSIVGRVESVERPLLPYRTDKRVCFPIGPIGGAYTGLELRYALRTNQLKIDSIGESLIWGESTPLLRNALLRLWELRARAGPSTALGQWLKWYGNSLTGKLAQNPEKNSTVINTQYGSEGKSCPANFKCGGVHSTRQMCCVHRCTGVCGRMMPLDKAGRFWTKQSYRIPMCGHIHWAAYMMAYARISLYGKISLPETAYCDTDSAYMERESTDNIGDELGQWKYEGRYFNAEFRSPKAYKYTDENGKVHAKLKGIPEAVKNWDKAFSEDGVRIDRGVWSLRMAIRKGGSLFSRKEMTRHAYVRTEWIGDRRIAPNGVDTYPTTIEEQLARKD